MVGGCDECGGWNGGENGVIEVAEQERGEGCGAWCAVMGDWEERGEGGEGSFIGVCCCARGEGGGIRL